MPQNFKQALNSKVDIDAGIFENEKFKRLRKYSSRALEFIVAVQQLINQTSYFVQWSDKKRNSVAEKLDISNDEVDNLIVKAIDSGWFDSDIFSDYGVLSSKDIQMKWYKDCRRRKLIQFDKKILLIRIDVLEDYPQYSSVKFIDDFTQPIVTVNPNLPKNTPEESPSPIPAVRANTEALKAKLEEIQTKKYLNAEELKRFIKLPYDKMPPEFKDMYSASWFKNYVEFSEGIIEHGDLVLVSERQIAIKDYVNVANEYFTKFGYKNPDFLAIVERMLGSEPIKAGTSMIHRFKQFEPGYTEDKKRNNKKIIKQAPEVILPSSKDLK